MNPTFIDAGGSMGLSDFYCCQNHGKELESVFSQ